MFEFGIDTLSFHPWEDIESRLNPLDQGASRSVWGQRAELSRLRNRFKPGVSAVDARVTSSKDGEFPSLLALFGQLKLLSALCKRYFVRTQIYVATAAQYLSTAMRVDLLEVLIRVSQQLFKAHSVMYYRCTFCRLLLRPRRTNG